MAGRDARPLMAAILRALGVAATVIRPDEDPIETDGVWVPLDSVALPEGSDIGRRSQMRCIAFDRDAVPTMPRGTLIDAPERKGAPVQTWLVDGLADAHAIDVDQVKAIVRLNRDPET